MLIAKNFVAAVVAALLAFTGGERLLAAEQKPTYTVKWAGALKDVHHGLDFGGKIDLQPLADLPHLYAVGPLENLQGEVTIWDGKALIARVKNKSVLVDSILSGKACFLVYGQVEKWNEMKYFSTLTLSQISEIIKQAATKYGINTNKPFPFLIEGTANDVQYHVMNRADLSPPTPGPTAHEVAKVHFTLKDSPVQLLGFYSEHHQGIFTHHNSSVHVHVKTPDDKVSGHLEELELAPGARLLLPIGYSK